MARIKGALNARKKHNRVLKLAKGYRGARSKQYRIAKQSVMRAQASQFAGRKQRKRDMRALWITRINAAARLNGLSSTAHLCTASSSLRSTSTVRCSPRWQSTTRQASPPLPRSRRRSWHNTDLNGTNTACGICQRIPQAFYVPGGWISIRLPDRYDCRPGNRNGPDLPRPLC